MIELNNWSISAVIRFPEDEQPFFCSLGEERIAAAVKCPLHGERFCAPHFHTYVSAWLREKQPLTLLRKSTQYQKAWAAGFPTQLWPAELVTVEGKDMLRLKDATILEAQFFAPKPRWRVLTGSLTLGENWPFRLSHHS